MTKKTDDPVEQLGKELAADHTLDKARREGEVEQTEEEATDVVSVDDSDDEAGEPTVVGDFGTFDEVREYASRDKLELVPGALAVVNGALVRLERDGTFRTVVSSLLDEYGFEQNIALETRDTLANIERAVLAAEFESGSLLGDLRDTVLGMFKGKQKNWSQMSQSEQRDLAQQVEAQARTILRKMTRVVAEGEEISVQGRLVSFSCKGEFDLKLSAPGDEEIAVELFRMVGHDVVIVSADSKRFEGSRGDVETMPDNLELDFANGDEPVEDEDLEDEVEVEIPEDDSDLADGDDELDAVDKAKAAAQTVADIDGPLEAEVDEESATEEREAGDSDVPAANYVSKSEPKNARPGQTWVNPDSDDLRPKHLHPNGKWYLTAPTEAALAEYEASLRGDNKADGEGGFPADPD